MSGSLLEKPRFEQVAKGVFRLGRCYIPQQGLPSGLWDQQMPTANRWWHQKTIGAYRTKRPSAG